ncbi:MAG TPA: methylamine utilization protein, partial [Tenacibaculum sp.]|nr:methylamine utilization protein [Tenacibaculum sp.]
QLTSSASFLDSINQTSNLIHKKELYARAREKFKLSEPILAHTDKHNYKSLNAPNLLIVKGEEHMDTKVLKPFGFQLIEEVLYEPKLDTLKLKQLLDVTSARLKLILNNLNLNLKDYHIIWILREQIVRIATTGITGFDSPVLNQSLLESSHTYETLKNLLYLCKRKFSSKTILDNILTSFENAQNALNTPFDDFVIY